ncbi:MAG: L-glyceraldehyde 3-phosphate reductase [Verrucomicrobia bacterium ADurb.Bin474]|nr:MAG: L-glyceraldehyde 3-phosphate reductase [Verrucomicrobia bacterium ADurb.Bin474]
MQYQAADTRYESMIYNRCGRSGLKLPALSLGLWQNFGSVDPFENQRTMVRRAFDLGITHFDLANNYGPVPGSAEENFGRLLKTDLALYRNELVISSKAGYWMWPGPYGEWGSRKYLISSCDASLKRLGLDCLDIFYSHRPDPETPLEETMGALDFIVRSGRAHYVGISNYDHEQTARACAILKELGTPCLIHQPRYNMLDRWAEDHLLDEIGKQQIGCIPFCPLAQGLLTNKYIDGIPAGSRASKVCEMKDSLIHEYNIERVRKLNVIARERGQSMAQMALAWLLKDTRITSALIGASKVSQIEDSLAALNNLVFSTDELARIRGIITS